MKEAPTQTQAPADERLDRPVSDAQSDLLARLYKRNGLVLDDEFYIKLANDPAWVKSEIDRLVPPRSARAVDDDLIARLKARYGVDQTA